MSSVSGVPGEVVSDEASVVFVGRAGEAVEAMAEALDSRASFEVDFATTADSVLDRLDEIECVVSGEQLPQRDAVGFLETVRESAPDLPFILLVTSGSEELASRAISAGVTDYLHADVDSPSVLEKRITNAVSKYRSEQRMRQGYRAIETAQEGISILDEDGRFTYVNEVYAGNYGYDPDELVGEHWELLYPDDEVDHVHEDILPTVHEQGTWTGITTGKRSDGSTFPEQHSLAKTQEGGLICVVRDISEQKEREEMLRERQQYLRSFHEIAADSTLSFEERLSQLLELGRDRFDLDIGFLSQIDRRNETFTIEAARSTHDLIQPGATIDLSQTYCRRLFDTDEPLDVANAAESPDWEDDPAYERFDLDCYIGTTISVANELYGSLCFASTTPRDESFNEAERTFLELMSEWLRSELARRRREHRIAALNDVMPKLMNAERPGEICDRFVSAAARKLDLPQSAVALYDGDRGGLAVEAKSDERFPVESLIDNDSPGWETFLEDEAVTLSDTDTIGAAEVRLQPLGNHGVYLAAKRDGAFTDGEREFIATAASNLEASLDRAERERLLQEREERLEEQNESLERLNRINDTIRSIHQGLVSASSRAELEQVVCQHLGSRGPYELAWIGEHEPSSGEIVPREWNGNDKGYLDTITIPHDEADSMGGPASRALSTLEPVVINDILTDREFEPWRQEALSRGYRSGVVLPLEYEGSVYGILCIYASQSDAFDDLERAVLSELSETVAHAINAIESKKGLVEDRVIELEYDLGPSIPLVEFADDIGAELSVESFVSAEDDRIRAFVTTRGVEAETFEEIRTLSAVVDVSVVAERDTDDGPECLFEVNLNDQSMVVQVLEHGGVVREFSVSDGTGNARLWVPASGEVREFAEMFDRFYPDTELRAKRKRDRDTETRGEFRARIEETLTRRQLEVLQTAYFSGFFETPRERTGTEIAESLDVSQPTFNTHLRTGQRKLFTLLFEGEDTRSLVG